ncbi:hypothetical protein [Bernardetia sp.]|uniref:hypothetical protein n=1 Tax=Bernardetia sp. TaxID=1937974 RepID=UPI0025C3737A|nr:hypothetical protein [Bernardetia sp.]
MNNTPKVNTIFDLIELRPAMYLGKNSITLMDVFLTGYNFACYSNDITQQETYPLFWYFHEWAMEKYGWTSSVAGWKNIILQGNEYDEAKALTVFFEMIDDFKKLRPISCEYVELNERNLKFHYSDLCKTKRYNFSSKIHLPVYEEADEILIIEHSHDFGYSIFVTHQNRLMGYDWRERFKNLQQAKSQVKRLFNTNEEQWQLFEGNLLEKLNDILR